MLEFDNVVTTAKKKQLLPKDLPTDSKETDKCVIVKQILLGLACRTASAGIQPPTLSDDDIKTKATGYSTLAKVAWGAGAIIILGGIAYFAANGLPPAVLGVVGPQSALGQGYLWVANKVGAWSSAATNWFSTYTRYVGSTLTSAYSFLTSLFGARCVKYLTTHITTVDQVDTLTWDKMVEIMSTEHANSYINWRQWVTSGVKAVGGMVGVNIDDATSCLNEFKSWQKVSKDVIASKAHSAELALQAFKVELKAALLAQPQNAPSNTTIAARSASTPAQAPAQAPT